MFFSAQGISDCGRVREHNEDTFRIDCEQGLFVVADGMGGHAAGEVASAIAVEILSEKLMSRDETSESSSEEYLQHAVQAANQAVYTNAQSNSERKGMGTTLTFLFCQGDRLFFGHVGDSRAYLLRNDELTQLTRDHTWVNMQVRAGVISPEEAEQAQMRHVLVKALGTEPEVEADIREIDVLPKDRFLLCSDGLSDLVGKEELRQVLLSREGPEEVAGRLVELANGFGGRDNITAVVIDCHDKQWKKRLKTAVNKLRR